MSVNCGFGLLLLSMLLMLWIPRATYGQDTDLREPFIRYGPKDQDVSKGEQVRLQCYVYGQPTPSVTWFKDGVALEENEAEGRAVEVDKSLVIQKARRNSKHDDSGVYYCYATNEVGSARSENAVINVKFISKPFVENPRNATVSIYSDHVMRCKPPVGYPKPVIEWLKDDQPLVTDATRIKVLGRMNESEIYFTRIMWKSRGVYKCVAKSSEGTRLSSPASITIKVILPDLYQNSKVIEAYEGKPATMQCRNGFQPEPTRTWSKSSGDMPPASRIQYQPAKKILLITNTQLSDGGEYKCLAKNEAGESSLNYQLVVYENMRFEVVPTGLKTSKGRTVRFDCIVKGGKNSKVLWLYGIYYDKSSAGRIRVDADNSLVIQNVEEGDAKKLQCVAEDVSKRIFSDEVQLEIVASTTPPPAITALPTVVEVEGSKLVLPCTATGPGPLTFEWLSAGNNKPVNVGADDVWIISGTDSSNLTLNKALVSDSGGYRCKVVGSSGSSSVVTMVTIKPSDGDKPPKVPHLRVINIGATAVTLTWSPPPTAILSPVTSYIITINDRARSKTWETIINDGSQTQWKLSKLSPSTFYSISIVAVNRKGEGKKTDFPAVETRAANPLDPNNNDRLENVQLKIVIGDVTSDTIEVKWNPVEAQRIKGYIIFYRVAGNSLFIEKEVMSNTAMNFVLKGLKQNTRYEIQMMAESQGYQSNTSPLVEMTTLRKIIIAVQNVRVTKHKDDMMTVGWDFPPNIEQAPGVSGVTVQVMHSNPRKLFLKIDVAIDKTLEIFHKLDPSERYYVTVAIITTKGEMKRSKEVSFRLKDMTMGEVVPRAIPVEPEETKGGEGGILAIVKEPWFIATVGVLLWLLLLVIVVLICCRRKKKHNIRDLGVYESRGLLPIGTGQRGMDYPNTSLNRTRLHGSEHQHFMSPTKRKICGCCGGSQSSSLDEDFPNRADIKPFTGYVRHDNIEMRQKAAGMDSLMKENNLGIAMRNGYKVDAPLNNELMGGYRQNSIDNRMYNGADRARIQPHMGVGGYREPVPPQPGSGSMSRRNDARIKQDSVDRRLGEIVRTKKQVPEDDVNVMDTNQQASWKREPKPKDPPSISSKPPGENTLRRQGKTQFKPLPNLEVLKWADRLPDSSKAPSTNDGSPPGSPKMSASAMSEAEQARPDSRLESHGGSSNSLNKYSFEKRRRRNSNASSMMSSELYQSEMDPSGYSDVVSDRKKRKEKAIPPPIDFDGLTSDILLQWAESVTNSSPSSSGSSSPSRLSGISSEGSLYTDEDFAQAVAAVAECGGFNMDYDYNLPGMNLNQPTPLSSTRNSKMDKIDQVFAQRSKPRNSPAVAGSKPASRPDTSTPQGYVPQISMSSYLTGSQKGPQSTHSSVSGVPRSERGRHREKGDKNNARYGTGFNDVVDSAKPLTVSNLLKHDSSLDREKKETAKPLTVSNLRHHETSLDRDRDRRQKPIAYDKPPPYESIEQTNGHRDGNAISKPNPLLPEAALSVTSALERHESMNSKDSLNSSNRHDSEIENNAGTSERRQQRKAKKHHLRDPQSSTSTVNTVHTAPEDESNC